MKRSEEHRNGWKGDEGSGPDCTDKVVLDWLEWKGTNGDGTEKTAEE